MSRCFPYPPPGYEPETIKLQNDWEKAKKEKKKEKRREKNEKRERKAKEKVINTDVKENQHKKRPRDETNHSHQNSEFGPKITVKEREALEGSGTTEEQGLPAVRYACNSSDSSQDSSKRRKHDTTADDSRSSEGNGLRIRLPLLKHKEPELPAPPVRRPEPLGPTSRQLGPSAKASSHLEPLASNSRRPETRDPYVTHPEPPATNIRQSSPPIAQQPRLPISTVRQPKPKAAIAGSPKYSVPTVKQPKSHASVADKPKLSASNQPRPHAAVGSHSVPDLQLPKPRVAISEQPKSSFSTVKQPKPRAANVEQQKPLVPIIQQSRQSPATIRTQTKHSPPRGNQPELCTASTKQRDLHAPITGVPKLVSTSKRLEPLSATELPCFSGRTEATHTQKEAGASSSKQKKFVGFSGSSRSRRKEAKFKELIVDWNPQQLQMEVEDDDQDWLVDSKGRYGNKDSKAEPEADTQSHGGGNSLSSWPPRACHLEGDVYALPFVLPF